MEMSLSKPSSNDDTFTGAFSQRGSSQAALTSHPSKYKQSVWEIPWTKRKKKKLSHPLTMEMCYHNNKLKGAKHGCPRTLLTRICFCLVFPEKNNDFTQNTDFKNGIERKNSYDKRKKCFEKRMFWLILEENFLFSFWHHHHHWKKNVATFILFKHLLHTTKKKSCSSFSVACHKWWLCLSGSCRGKFKIWITSYLVNWLSFWLWSE